MTAGRLGLKVALLESQGALGGVWTSGLLSCLLGFDRQVPQAFSWGWIRSWGKPELDRFPTCDELRSMSWQSIAGGANGILWYAANMIFGRMQKDREEGERCWSMLVKVAEEVNAKMPWLVSEESAPEVVGHPKVVAVRTFRKNGKVAVLITNRTSEPVSGKAQCDIFGVKAFIALGSGRGDGRRFASEVNPIRGKAAFE